MHGFGQGGSLAGRDLDSRRSSWSKQPPTQIIVRWDRDRYGKELMSKYMTALQPALI